MIFKVTNIKPVWFGSVLHLLVLRNNYNYHNFDVTSFKRKQLSVPINFFWKLIALALFKDFKNGRRKYSFTKFLRELKNIDCVFDQLFRYFGIYFLLYDWQKIFLDNLNICLKRILKRVLVQIKPLLKPNKYQYQYDICPRSSSFKTSNKRIATNVRVVNEPLSALMLYQFYFDILNIIVISKFEQFCHSHLWLSFYQVRCFTSILIITIELFDLN